MDYSQLIVQNKGFAYLSSQRVGRDSVLRRMKTVLFALSCFL